MFAPFAGNRFTSAAIAADGVIQRTAARNTEYVRCFERTMSIAGAMFVSRESGSPRRGGVASLTRKTANYTQPRLQERWLHRYRHGVGDREPSRSWWSRDRWRASVEPLWFSSLRSKAIDADQAEELCVTACAAGPSGTL